MSNSIINPKRLYVSNLPAHVTVDDLKREFGNYGVVAVAEVIRDKKGRSRRFGFVSFRDATSTKCAECNVDRKIFGECEINVEFATRRRNPFTAKDKNLPANTTQNKSQPPACSLENEELERRLQEEERYFNQARRQSSSFAEPTQLEEYNYFHSYHPEDYDYLRSYQREYVEPLSAPILQRYQKKYYYPQKSRRGERVVFLTDPDQKAAYRDNPTKFIHENQEFIERNAVYIESPRRSVVYQRAPRYYPSPRDLTDPRSPLASRKLRADAPEFSPSESPQRSKEKVEERKSQSEIQAELELRKSQIDIQTEVWKKVSERSREIEEGKDNGEDKKDSNESEDSPRPKNLKTDEKTDKPSEKTGDTAAQSKPVTNVDELQESQE